MEILYKSMIIEGLLLIQEGVNTNYMEEKLSSFIAEAKLNENSGSGTGGRKRKK
jgi:flagellar motor component MotA